MHFNNTNKIIKTFSMISFSRCRFPFNQIEFQCQTIFIKFTSDHFELRATE